MSAVAKLQALKTPVIPLVANVPFSEYPTTCVSYTHNAGTLAACRDVTNKLDLPFCPDSSDKECLLRTIHEFQDGCIDTRLHVDTPHRYTLIREVLGGDLRTTWDTYVATIADADRNDDNWPTHMRTYLRNFLPANAFLLQGEYLNQSIKPKAMDCYTLNSRLGLMNTLSVLLPGSGGNQLLPDALSRKNKFFKLMLAEWQLKLTSNGVVLDNANYTINQLVDFMEQQRIFWDAEQEAKQRCRNHHPGRHNSHNCESYAPGRFGSRPPNNGPGRGPTHPYQGSSGSPYGQRPRFGFGRGTPRNNRAPNPGRGGRGSGATPLRSPYNLRRRPAHGRGPPPHGARRQLHYYTDNHYQEPHSTQGNDQSLNEDPKSPSSYDPYAIDTHYMPTPTPHNQAHHTTYTSQDQYHEDPQQSSYDDNYYIAGHDDYAHDDWVQDY